MREHIKDIMREARKSLIFLSNQVPDDAEHELIPRILKQLSILAFQIHDLQADVAAGRMNMGMIRRANTLDIGVGNGTVHKIQELLRAAGLII